ncbi:FAD/NAD(P)-binding domain-containing protein [Hypoxylon rubiginosum]|uniref:FAD/NAD(P)-binding domain-containing protein n=1 Tax=Hypoxylon rubiginosum TaxID=110542 RepID=A0ACC0CWQ0_9PEZI|nr:FAD/NAD(P)-binding domain-containing protein [Hypoxylon rubiginosum]
MKVLISGAGIAGNALAFWLSKLGHDVTVVEWFPNLRATGLQIDLRGPGIQVLRRMGLEQAFRAKAAPEQGFQVVDGSGRRRAYFPANKSGKGLQSLTSDFEIMRGDLCHLLHDATEGRAKYVFGTSIESFEERDKGVEVWFTGGKTDTYDLVVGADGQWSKTRKMMLGPDTPDALVPLGGVYTAYFTIPRPIQKGEEYIATVYMATGRRGLFLRRHSPDTVQVYIGCTSDSDKLKNARRGDTQAEKEALAEVFQGAGWQSQEIVEAMRNADDFYCERMALVKLDSWSHGRVTLVGDAGYCPSATTGMGTTCGVVGAYILAGEIARHCGGEDSESGLETALKAYEEKFRPFMDQVQEGVASDSKSWGSMPSSAFGIGVLNSIVGLVSFLRIDVAKWFLKEDAVKDWKLPEYSELPQN